MLAMVSMLTVSYSGAFFLLAGILAAWFIIFLAPRIIAALHISPVLGIVLGLIIVSLVMLILFAGTGSAPMQVCMMGSKYEETEFHDYHAIIEPIDFLQGVFRVTESGTYVVTYYECIQHQGFSYGNYSATRVETNTVSLPERQTLGSSRGLLIREVNVIPLADSALSNATCCYGESSIELRDFPRDSFYEARDVQKAEVYPYLDTETIKWDRFVVDRSITFAYLAEPFYSLRGLLAPLIGLSYKEQWPIALFGLLATAVIIPIVKPVLIELGRNRLKNKIASDTTGEDTKNATLIVSGRGDEKQVTIKTKNK